MKEKKIKRVVEEYLVRTTKEVKKIAEKGAGKEILGETINRPEDFEIGIDRIGEEILRKLLRKNKLKATVFNEPENRDIKEGEDFYGALDPFDGSMLYLRGLEHNWYTCLTFFDKECTPLVCGIADIINEKYYITEKDGNYVVSMKKRKKKKIKRSPPKKLSEPIVLASYIMSSQYSSQFLRFFGDLVKNMDPKGLFYPHGGSYIYGLLAEGVIDAYVMFNEPRSEIDPGYTIAERAGCEVVSVNSNGNYENYKFVPGKQHNKVEFLIAASCPELRDQLINHYLNNKKYERE